MMLVHPKLMTLLLHEIPFFVSPGDAAFRDFCVVVIKLLLALLVCVYQHVSVMLYWLSCKDKQKT